MPTTALAGMATLIVGVPCRGVVTVEAGFRDDGLRCVGQPDGRARERDVKRQSRPYSRAPHGVRRRCARDVGGSGGGDGVCWSPVVVFMKSVEETVAVQAAGSRARLSVTVTAPKSPAVPMVEPTVLVWPMLEPRSTVPSGAVMVSVPVVVTVNVTGVASGWCTGRPGSTPGRNGTGIGGVSSARPAVAAPAGRAVATRSAPTAATLPAATRDSGLCMGFPPVELVKV